MTSNFGTGNGQKAFPNFFRDPLPPVHVLLQRNKANSLVPTFSFSHCMAFLERGGIGTGMPFSFPCKWLLPSQYEA